MIVVVRMGMLVAMIMTMAVFMGMVMGMVMVMGIQPPEPGPFAPAGMISRVLLLSAIRQKL